MRAAMQSRIYAPFLQKRYARKATSYDRAWCGNLTDRDHAFAGSIAALGASNSLASTNRLGTFAARSRSHAAAIMIRMPAPLTTSCSQTPLVYCIRIQCAPKDRNTPKQKIGSEC